MLGRDHHRRGCSAISPSEGRLGEVASLTLLVCALDNAQAGTTEALATRPVAAAAVAESARRGYLDGDALASVFSWLRPNDLIWNYVVNNYLLGKEPPAFDILYWNQDTVRMAAGLHRDFVMMALDSALATPGGTRVLGSDVDLGKVDLDTYIVAGSNDHIVDWRNAYRSTQLLGGDSRFVLSTSGHIQALINPPRPDSRSSYRIADANPPDVADWEAAATTQRGSWWPDYIAWLRAARGERVPAPKRLGSRAPQGDRQGARHLRAGGMTEPVPTGRWWGDHVGETRWILEAARLAGRPGLARSRRPARGRPRRRAGPRLRRRRPHARRARRLAAADRYRPAVCGFVLNADCSERALERVERRVAALHARSGRRVAVIGHSRGGHFARAVAARRPELVSHAVSLGADLQAMFHCSAPILAAAEGTRRVLSTTGRARRPECVTTLPVLVHRGVPGAVPDRPRAPHQRLLQAATASCAGRRSSCPTPTASRSRAATSG